MDTADDAQRRRHFGEPVPLERIALRFADRVPPHLRGLSAQALRAQAEAAFARHWQEAQATQAHEDDDPAS